MRSAALLPLALVLLAGCLEPPRAPSQQEEWRFGGAWTSEFTQSDIAAWCELAREYGNECIVMESWPPQYGLRFDDAATCEEARERVLALPHITARPCAKTGAAGDPSVPTSSPPASTWRLHGTFAPGYTAADVEAVCRAGTGEPRCAMMKSEPPQYAFTFATQAECEAARERIAAVAAARPDACAPAP